MKKLKLYILTILTFSTLMLAACANEPKDFNLGEETSAPFGYTECLKREDDCEY